LSSPSIISLIHVIQSSGYIISLLVYQKVQLESTGNYYVESALQLLQLSLATSLQEEIREIFQSVGEVRTIISSC
jgi:hypothetical protein